MIFEDSHEKFDLGAEASQLLTDAKQEYEKLSKWPFEKPSRRPYQSFPLRKSMDHEAFPAYPKRIDIYCYSTAATMSNSWRLAQVHILTIIASMAALLGTRTSRQDTALALKTEKETAEHSIRELIDDICCSIPFILGSDDIEAIATYYPHSPNSTNIPSAPGPNVIAAMSHFKNTLEVGSQAYCIPYSQRQWMQQYLTLLSRDQREDQEKALNLELV